MRFAVCVVRDAKADVFGTPFFMGSLGQAERQFVDEINRVADDNTMYKHPDDFELYHLGWFDAVTARFELLPDRQQIIHGSSCKRKTIN